jgi:hypothetical protein
MDATTSKKHNWQGNLVEECLRKWILKLELKDFKCLPLITSWGI